MKKDIHPKEYRPVIFIDNSNGAQFLISSTINTKEKVKWTDGKEYPAFHVEISSASHPFYTNQEKTLDSAGRVEKFKTRQSKATSKKSDKKA
jgi:large subunit ribosomal protein L31